MIIPSLILAAYLVSHAAVAFTGKKSLADGPRGGVGEFALAGRSLSGPILLATMAASNLSAFTVFGVSGAAYRLGWAFFPAMCFGTALMAASFAYLGVPMRRLAASGGWTTPGQLVSGRLGSARIGAAFSALSLVYTVPYLAVQAGAGGRLIASVTGFPEAACSAALVALITAYVLRGGMAGVAKGDAVQLAAMLCLTVAAAGLAAWKAGEAGLLKAAFSGKAVYRAGADGSMGMAALSGYYLLWSLADPMFPHLTQRFLAAKSDKALYSTMAAYPLVSIAVFFPVSLIGALGAAMIPGLPPSRSDAIFTALASSIAGPTLGPIFSIAALAALVSTMDSQLLSCASILSSDLVGSRARAGRAARLSVIALGIGAWLVSLDPPESILSFLNRTAFPGYASLLPVALAAVYAPRLGRIGAGPSLIAGTALVLAEAAGWIQPPIPAALFNLGAQAAAFAASAGLASLLKASGGTAPKAGLSSVVRPRARRPAPLSASSASRIGGQGDTRRRGRLWPYAAAIALTALLGLDAWNFSASKDPSWTWLAYHLAATLGLSAAYAAYGRAADRLNQASIAAVSSTSQNEAE